MQRILTIRNNSNNNQWQSELSFQTIIETECNNCDENKMIFLASRNITASGEQKFYCYECATQTVERLQDPVFEFIVESPTLTKEIILNDLLTKLESLKQNLKINVATNNDKENTKENATINTNTNETESPSKNTAQNPINDNQTIQPQNQPQPTVENRAGTKTNQGKETPQTKTTTEAERHANEEAKAIAEENKTEDFILNQVKNQQECPSCRKIIAAVNLRVADGCQSCVDDDKHEAIKRSAVQAQDFYTRYKKEYSKPNCSNCQAPISDYNERVELIDDNTSIPYWKCQVCLGNKSKEQLQAELNRAEKHLSEEEKAERDAITKKSKEKEEPKSTTPPVEVDQIQAEINRLMELKRQKELQAQQPQPAKTEEQPELVKSDVFEYGTWQDLFTPERLPHMMGKVRLVFLDPPYGIDYKGFAYDNKDLKGVKKDWIVNGVDFSFIPRITKFLTSDGLIVIWNTLENCYALRDWMKENTTNFKTTILYWVKPVYTTFGLTPTKNSFAVEGIITIGVRKTYTNDWYHGAIFCQPSKRSMDGMKKVLYSQGWKEQQENENNDEFQTAERIYSHNEETGHPYAYHIRDTAKGKKMATTGRTWKPLTLYTELINLYTKGTRPLAQDDYIIDLFSGASSGSSYIVSRLFKTKFWGSEYAPNTYNYLADYLVKFMDSFMSNENTNHNFMMSVFENACLCIDYLPIGDKRKRFTREQELEGKIRELESINARLITENKKMVKGYDETINRKQNEVRFVKSSMADLITASTKLKQHLERLGILEVSSSSTDKKIV